jgi:hypothetical protein
VYEQPAVALHLLLVFPRVQLGDDLGVHGGVVGAAVVVQQPLAYLDGGLVEVVDRIRVEHSVRVGAVVSWGVPVLAEDRVHVRLGIGVVEVGGDLRGALPCADDHKSLVDQVG